MVEASNTHTRIGFRAIRFTFKIILWLALISLGLVLILLLGLQVPQTQAYLARKGAAYLQQKFNSEVNLKNIGLSMGGKLQITGLYVEDKKGDTLLSLGILEAELNLAALFQQKIEITSVELSNAAGHIRRNRYDEDFNFSFIPKAFEGGQPDTSLEKQGSGWEISIMGLHLENVSFTFRDKRGGLDVSATLASLQAKTDVFDLEKSRIALEDLILKNSSCTVLQDSSFLEPDTAASSPAFDIDVNNLVVAQLKTSYINDLTGQHLGVELGNLKVKSKDANIPKLNFDISDLELSDTRIVYRITKKATADTSSPEKIIAEGAAKVDAGVDGPAWNIRLSKLDLKNNSFSYDNENKIIIREGFDAEHLALSGINIKAEKIIASEENYELNLQDLNFREKCGLTLTRFSSGVRFNGKQMQLSKMYLKTANSEITEHLEVNYTSLAAIGKDPGATNFKVHLNRSNIALADVLYFVPDLLKDPILNQNCRNKFLVTADVEGKLSALEISRLKVFTGTGTGFDLSASVKELLDTKKLFLDLRHFNFKGGSADIFDMLSQSAIPVQIPEKFTVSARLRGYLKNFDGKLDLTSSIGALAADLKMDPGAGNVKQPYNLKCATRNFDAGYLLRDKKTLGPLTMSVSIVGSGMDTSDLDAKINLNVRSAQLMAYDYKDLALTGHLYKSSFNGKASMDDKNLAFVFDGMVDFAPATAKCKFTFDLKGADLRALQLTDDDLRVKTYLEADLTNFKGKNPLGVVKLSNCLLVRDARRIPLDSLVITSEEAQGVSKIKMRSGIMSANVEGIVNLKELDRSVLAQLNRHFSMQHDSSMHLGPQDFKFDFKVNDPTILIGNVIPKLEALTPFAIDGELNSAQNKFALDIKLGQVKYDGLLVDSLSINVNSSEKELSYSINVAEVSDATIKFENTSLEGGVMNNNISFKLSATADDSIKAIELAGSLKKEIERYALTFDKKMILNGEEWKVDDDNYLAFGKRGVFARHLNIKSSSQGVSVNSLNQGDDAPLELKFDRFELGTISKLMGNKKELIGGNVNGMVLLEHQEKVSAFRSDLVISDLVFRSVPVGTIKLKADNFEDNNKYDLDLSIEGFGNNIAVKGNYIRGVSDNNLHLEMDMKNLALASVEPFTFEQVTQMEGTMSGKLSIRGTARSPDLLGALNLRSAALKPAIMDSYLTIPDAKFYFEGKKVRFNNFTVFDSLGNKAVINGITDIKDLKNPVFDLRLKSDDFLALNTGPKDNPLYYGTVFLDSDIKLKGTTEAPVIDLRARLNKGSSVTYVKPEDMVSKDESKGIVEFKDTLQKKNDIMFRNNDSLLRISGMKGIDLSANIDFDRSVKIKMIVDPVAGDSLFIKGGGLLDFSLDQSGKTSLTGKYRINDGGYFLTINEIVKRNFKIEKGSTVTWSGEVLDAYVDLKAIYTIKTSPLDLVQNELGGLNELEKNKYRNLLTFNVYLKMTGFISSPEISFDIQLAPKDRGALNGAVNARLAQLAEDETQLNKQVFALLTLKRFVGDNPLESSSNGGFTSASRSSASQVLTQQLNSISGRYVNFVDLDLGVNSFEDYSTGEEQGRTQLQVGVSKQLWNDKVTVRVGGNVELEGEKAKQNNANDMAGNISIDYKLTEDGRYKLKAFRENQYENPIEGELTKTGVGVIYTRNFNRFRELLKKPVKQTKMQRNGDR